MKTEFFLFDVDYTVEEVDGREKGIVRLFGKTKNGETVCILDKNFYPFFYAVPNQNEIDETVEKIKDIDEDDLEVKDVEVMDKIVDGEEKKALKIYTYSPSDTSKLRNIVKKIEEVGKGNCYEFSMPFYRQYAISKEIKPGDWVSIEGNKIEEKWNFDVISSCKELNVTDKKKIADLKTMAFDIESYREGGRNKVIMLSLRSDDMEKVLTYKQGDYSNDVERLGSEKELMERFIDIVNEEDPDIMVSYNGDEYDFKVLRERAEELGLELTLSRDGSRMEFIRRGRASSAKLRGRLHIDLYKFIDNIFSPQFQTEVLSLNAVASEVLDKEKIDMSLEDILESWREEKDLEKMAKYCMRDSELTYKLSDNLLPQVFELSKVSGQFPFDVTRMTYGQLVEWYLIREAHPERMIPNRPKWKEIQKRRRESPYEGGFVKEPIPGIHNDITVLDFQSLYPTIIVTFNIDPEMLNCGCCKNDNYDVPGFDHYFCKNERGFIPEVVRNLIDQRSEIKERMKGLDENSSEYTKLDNRQYSLKILANSVYGYYGYQGARWYSRECAESITSFGREWIKRTMEKAENEGFEVVYGDTDSLMLKGGYIEDFLEEINNELPGIMELEFEDRYERGLFIGEEGKGVKKRYVMVDKEGNLTIRGFEVVRRDWCDLAKNLQRKVLMYVLADENEEKAKDYVKEVVKRIENKDVDLKDLIIYTQLNKPISEYKSKGPHVVAAEKLKKIGKPVGEGMTVMYVI
ncbi:MAG: DNA-directed DNA polymerase, partial [Candidatus Aenigmatarchaeota archaeon]